MKNKKGTTIRKQIFSGYLFTVLLTFCLVLVSLICLYLIYSNYQTVERNRANQFSTQSALVAHYEWLDNLSISIQTGASFSGSLDHNTCSLGKWIAGVTDEDIADSTIYSALQMFTEPHQAIHSSASLILELAASDSNAAYLRYANEIKPNVAKVIDDLGIVSARYKEMGDAAAHSLQMLIRFSIIFSILLTFLMIAIAIYIANKISTNISRPISAVAEWSKKLSLGEENIDFDSADLGSSEGSEIGVMFYAFKQMAQSIQDNVNVVRRVADGDMTAFVNIRSREDSLGKNLYRMVQSNDLLFSEIVHVAQTVANGSSQIANASHALSQSATVQANAVHQLSETVDHAGDLIEQSSQKAHTATRISEQIKTSVQESNGKMQSLVHSVNEIRGASEKISSVIKSIDDIAFQTNILALNASIEAARAGVAGKGFAVVADEVRELALKSANAANESKVLIESTISKTHEGSKISLETSEMFGHITKEIEHIVTIIDEIDHASAEQLLGIKEVRTEITAISDASTTNAASSEQSAAASAEMSSNAALLKQAMTKFNLRQRHSGHAYIPPEKQNDPQFIAQAEENYKKSLQSGKPTYDTY